MGLLLTILQSLWLMLPAYLSNMLPVVVGGGTPIDFGKNWKDGRRILGNGKTWRGLILAPAVAVLLIGAIRLLVPRTALGDNGFSAWGPDPWWALIAYALGFGALAGDALESFFKRRTGRERGEPWFPFDQLDFVVGSLFLGLVMSTVLALVGATAMNWFVEDVTGAHVLVIVLLTPALHLLVNYVGYKMGLKEVPW